MQIIKLDNFNNIPPKNIILIIKLDTYIMHSFKYLIYGCHVRVQAAFLASHADVAFA